jgi:PTS system mannose-specific IIC component
MEVWQAAVLALFCYLGALTTPWALGTTGGWYVITRPLIAGLVTGIVLGDVATGVLIGVAVQAVYIGLITPGGAVPADLSFVSYLGIPIAMTAGLEPGAAVGLSVAFGVIGVAAWQILSVGNAAWAHLCDSYAERGEINGIIRVNYLAQIGTFVLRFILPFIILMAGAAVADNMVAFFEGSIPWFLQYLGILGAALPAVGIAILIFQIATSTRQILWFLIGWVLAVYFELSIVAVAAVGALIAVIYYMYLYQAEEQPAAEEV